MRYVDALSWLYRRQQLGVKYELENMKALLALMSNPERSFRALHVTGTNGKGSTSHFLAAMVRAGGHRVGLYTSPHLVTFRERIAVDGRLIEADEVAAGVEELRPHVEALEARRIVPTFFECVTALAFWFFQQQAVPLVVLEVGMGGRLDATNVCDNLVSVITNVGLDHTQVLGTSVQAIAREKAGILRPGRPCVTGARREALDVIAREAQRAGAVVKVVRAPEATEETLEGNRFRFPFAGQPRDVHVAALGRHQASNACLALGTLDAVRAEVPVEAEAALAVLHQMQVPGRLEVTRRSPWQFLDGAHNGEAMEALGEFLGRQFAGKRVAACVGILRDKPAARMLATLGDRVSRLVLTRVPNERAISAKELGDLLPPRAPPHKEIDDPEEALRDLYAGDEDVTVVTGSLYLVGETRARLLRLERDPPTGMVRNQ